MSKHTRDVPSAVPDGVDDDGLPEIDQEAMNARIAERLGVPVATVDAVIDVEIEFQVGVGICDDPDWEFQHWDRAELAGRDPEIDEEELAAAAARFLGVPASLASSIFQAEFDELVAAGLVEDFDEEGQW